MPANELVTGACQLVSDAGQIGALQQACHKQLASHIDIDSVFAFYAAANMVSDDKLRSACMPAPTTGMFHLHFTRVVVLVVNTFI